MLQVTQNLSRLTLRALMLSALLATFGGAVPERTLMDQVRDRVEELFEGTPDSPLPVGTVTLEALRPFYRNRGYRPAWLGPGGLRRDAVSVVETLRAADTHGLAPSDYHVPRILARLNDTAPERMAELDVLVTDAFFHYCLDVRSGRADPRDADPEWFVVSDGINHLEHLEHALASHTVEGVLQMLHPPDPRYARLRQALTRYRRTAARGGWAALPAGAALRQEMRDPSVVLLRERLRASGDLAIAGGDMFDSELEDAVRRFQNRHGLEVDGVVGPKTRATLNVPVDEWIEQMVLNMERWRWMPRELGRRYILVNMAGFELQAIEDERPVMRMRVIVGRAYRRTPAFSKPISYLVFNPYWNVPSSIARKDILPRLSEDPDYLARQHIRVFSDWTENAHELDSRNLDASQIGRRKLRQDPGPWNALGQVKFMLPNRFNVYLHDTSHRELFDRTVRTFSSGCIRLERPLDLASYVLKDDPRWNPDSIRTLVESGERKVVQLRDPLPVFLVYWTVWVERDGMVHFRDDVYGRDGLLRVALNAKKTHEA